MGEKDTEGVTVRGDRAVECVGERGSERSSAVAKLFETDELLELDEFAAPFHWPNLSADDAAREWPALRSWVERLMARFSHLDHHVIPRCWFLHNGHVEALAALRDQERVNYGETAPGPPGWTGIGHFETLRLACANGPLSFRVARPMNREPAKVTRRHRASGTHLSRKTSNAGASQRSMML